MKRKTKIIWEIFINFFRISLFTVGGGAVMIPLVMDTVVDKKKWMTKEEIIDSMAISQSLPGAIIINNSLFIGRRVAGVAGAIAAFLGVVLPSFICILIIMQFLDKIIDSSYVLGFFKGALAAASALILVACFKLGKEIIKNIADIAIALASFILIVFFDVSIVFIIIGGGILGLILYYSRLFILKKKSKKEEDVL